MKTRVRAKIGTNASSEIVLRDIKDVSNIEKGDVIYGMKSRIYDSLHSSLRRLKSCQYWERYYVTDLEPILFLSL